MKQAAALDRIDVDHASREQLIGYINELEWRVNTLLPSDSLPKAIKLIFTIPRQQALVLAALMDGRVWTSEKLFYLASQWNAEIGEKIVHVLISNVRKILPPGGKIVNEYGYGYRMNEAAISFVKNKLAEAQKRGIAA